MDFFISSSYIDDPLNNCNCGIVTTKGNLSLVVKSNFGLLQLQNGDCFLAKSLTALLKGPLQRLPACN